MGKLSTDEVTSELSNLTGWIFLNDCIEKEYTFDSYLDGIALPFLDQQDGWTVDGTEFKVRLDAAAKALAWEGLYKNAGS